MDENGRTSLRKYNNFTLIPITSFKRHHIGIDSQAFFHLLKKSGYEHKLLTKSYGRKKEYKDMKPKEMNVLWRELFDIEKSKEYLTTNRLL